MNSAVPYIIGACVLAYIAIPLILVAAKVGLLDQMGIGVFIDIRPVDHGYGLFVTKVQPNTPAAGIIEAGDRILEVDGVAIIAPSEQKAARLRNLISGREGTLTNITIDRSGRSIAYSFRRRRLHFLEIPVD